MRHQNAGIQSKSIAEESGNESSVAVRLALLPSHIQYVHVCVYVCVCVRACSMHVYVCVYLLSAYWARTSEG